MINRQDISAYIYIDHSAEEPRVYFSEAHRHDPLTASALAGLLRQAPATRFEPVHLDQLRQLQSSQDSGRAATEMSRSEQQSRVISYFRQAVKLNASDIHLLIGYQDVTLVQLRIHGQLRTVAQLEREEGLQLAATIVLSMCDVTEKSFNANRAQDGRLRSEFVGQLGIFGARYAHTPAEFGLYVVMRLLPDDSESLPTPHGLGFLPAQQTLITRMLSRPEGIIIISGPTGSGKSTSLRCFSRLYLQQSLESKRLLTIEDPPEGMIPGAVQTPVIADRTDPQALSQAWSRGISSALRLDPDAMIIGEIRDHNSVRAALSAAKSGHLVQTTLHANDAIGILERLTDTLRVPLPEIADAQLVIGLIAQRLIAVLCPNCKLSWQQKLPFLSGQQREFLQQHCDAEKLCFRHPDGCPECWQGTVGRKMIAEVIRPDARFMELYRYKGKAAARDYWLEHQQGITRTAHLKDYLRQGMADPLEADLISPLDEDHIAQGGGGQ
ncbi:MULTISPECIES: ATPase, T2SS/T4P/T4SS family [Tatumella]|uniref:GspE/PulE family protein n=1 Tax=Tatumella punctata TaxID=399969 RepID=A0ABW1VM15_9GAMM|nr:MULTISPECIES: ATPase, T2SS/T4P/T4SS family [unclassified Tatumella]